MSIHVLDVWVAYTTLEDRTIAKAFGQDFNGI